MKIFTSIPPFLRGEALAQVRRWQQHGLSVASVVSAGETSTESHQFPELVVQRDAFDRVGKHLVYLDDILSLATADTDDVNGIVNADIDLVGGPNFAAFLAKEAQGGLIFGSRIDIADLNICEGNEYSVGFDFFFFDKVIVRLFPPTDYCLGAPWWDYWMPLVPLLHGLPAKLLVTPVAYHPMHENKWSKQQFDYFGRQMAGYLKSQELHDLLPDDLRAAVDRAMSSSDFLEFSRAVRHYIRKSAEPVFYPETPHLAEMAILGKAHYRQMTTELESYRNRLQDLETSKSWRLTKPLRWLIDKLGL